MIAVNLLPHHLRPIKRTPLPYIGALAVVLLALAVMAFLFVGMQAQIVATRGKLNGVNERLTKLKPVMEEYDQLQKKKQLVSDKLATINEIVAGE